MKESQEGSGVATSKQLIVSHFKTNSTHAITVLPQHMQELISTLGFDSTFKITLDLISISLQIHK